MNVCDAHPLDPGSMVCCVVPRGRSANRHNTQCHMRVQRRQAVQNFAQTGLVSRVPCDSHSLRRLGWTETLTEFLAPRFYFLISCLLSVVVLPVIALLF